MIGYVKKVILIRIQLISNFTVCLLQNLSNLNLMVLILEQLAITIHLQMFKTLKLLLLLLLLQNVVSIKEQRLIALFSLETLCKILKSSIFH